MQYQKDFFLHKEIILVIKILQIYVILKYGVKKNSKKIKFFNSILKKWTYSSRRKSPVASLVTDNRTCILLHLPHYLLVVPVRGSYAVLDASVP